MDYSASFWVGGHPRAKGSARVFNGRLIGMDAKTKAWQKQVRLVATREENHLAKVDAPGAQWRDPPAKR